MQICLIHVNILYPLSFSSFVILSFSIDTQDIVHLYINVYMYAVVMGSNTPPYSSSLDDNLSDYSTGYLQDALFEFSSKRRRLLLFSEDQTNYSACPIQVLLSMHVLAGYTYTYMHVVTLSDRSDTTMSVCSLIQTLIYWCIVLF